MSELILWKVSALASDMASVRYRALLPALGLHLAGIRSRFTSTARMDLLANARALIVVKSFAVDDVILASEAKSRGVPVFYDLCDNIFVPGYRGKGDMSPAEMFARIVHYCSAVTVPTAALRDVLATKVPEGMPIIVIADCAETGQERAEAIALFARSSSAFDAVVASRASLRLRAEHALRLFVRAARARWRAKRAAKTARAAQEASMAPWRLRAKPLLLWFGNRGNSYTKSGLGDLLVFRSALARASRELGAELLVVSNSRAMFDEVTAQLGIHCYYEEWTLDLMEEALALADVVLVPNSVDEFSVCKSANRSLLALKRRVPVVASPTRALAELRDCVWQKDAFEGIRLFLTNRAAGREWVERARTLLERQFSVKSVGRAWQSVIDSYSITNQPRRKESRSDLLMTVGLAQDLDVIAPILTGARERGLECFVYVALSVAQNSARVIRYLAENKVNYAVLPDKFDARIAEAVVSRHKAAFFPSETSLNPHRFSHRLCKFANRARLATFTIQHGLDNVGLTYSDDVHKAEEVAILSRNIFIWGGFETLHPKVSANVRQRCLSVGCPKPAAPPRVSIERLQHETRPIVGVFENLHWHRYTDEYRSRFLASVAECAALRPDVLLLIKPHNAGMWLTARYKGEPINTESVLIADPAHPDWEHFTAPQLLGYLRGVVTTPSTVALDGARAGLPTAVMRFDCETSRYEPLPMIDSVHDLTGFVADLQTAEAHSSFETSNADFIHRHIRSGDAVARILDTIEREIGVRGRQPTELCDVAT
jgi:hypothetical protein